MADTDSKPDPKPEAVPEKAAVVATDPVTAVVSAIEMTVLEIVRTSHSGTVTSDFVTHYNGCVITYKTGSTINADPAQKTFLDGCPISWRD